jgi:low affinity Fe/Cu permease
MQQFFRRLAQATAQAVGTPWTFLGALVIVLVWAASGPAFQFSDTWQLVINTGTTIVTFLMVFLIQNTQNRDAKVMHLKLDELIRATHTARNRLVDMEAMSDEELAALQREFKELHRRAGEALEERRQHDRRVTPPGTPLGTRAGDEAASMQRDDAAAGRGKGNGQG